MRSVIVQTICYCCVSAALPPINNCHTVSHRARVVVQPSAGGAVPYGLCVAIQENIGDPSRDVRPRAELNHVSSHKRHNCMQTHKRCMFCNLRSSSDISYVCRETSMVKPQKSSCRSVKGNGNYLHNPTGSVAWVITHGVLVFRMKFYPHHQFLECHKHLLR